jgi:dihydropyrimidinase
MAHDLAIRGGTLATATETFNADIGIRNGRIVTISEAYRNARWD